MADKTGKTKRTPEEYRRVLLRERRRTMRTVRNTLLGIAILAALWFVVLLVRDRTVRHFEPAPTPPAVENN